MIFSLLIFAAAHHCPIGWELERKSVTVGCGGRKVLLSGMDGGGRGDGDRQTKGMWRL